MSRARAAGAWMWPSVAATAAMVVVAGLADAFVAGVRGVGLVAGVGVAAWLAAPLALGLALAARLVWRGWRPAELARALEENGGASPRLWAWLGFVAVAAVALGATTVGGVQAIARNTAFKPLGVSLLLPLYVVPAALVLVALSRPCVDALAVLVRRGDAALARRLGRPVATARAALVVAVVVAVLAPVVAWYALARPRMAYVDPRAGLYAAIALVLVPAGHVLGRRALRPAAVALVAAAVGAVAVAGWARVAEPRVLLDLWGQPTMASESIDRLVDLEALRTDLSVRGFRPVARPGGARRDILVISFDTMRADRTPVYGGPASMPNLAALAGRGAVFAWAFAPGNVTRRSLPTLVTGASPSRIRGKVRGWALRMDPRHVAVWERFRAVGYDTAGFLCCEGFFAPERRLGLQRGLAHVTIEREGAKLVSAAREWYAARAARGDAAPTLVWLHFIETHNWYEESRELAGAADRARYDFVLGKADALLGELMAIVEARPPERRPIIVVTSDHAEALGDHGQPYHSTDLYNSQIRVPLVVAGPGVRARRYWEPVGLADVAPTLLELAGFEAPGMPEMDGRSLADLVTGQREDQADGGGAYSEMVPDRFVAVRARALVHGPWKLIERDGAYELYDLRTDPGELRDLAGSPNQAAVLEQMRARLRERAAQARVPAFYRAP